MRPPSIMVLGILAVLLSGCVTAGHPKSASTTTADSALVRGHVADPLRFYTHGEPNVNITAIDNRGTPLFTTNYHVPSGKHLVTVYVFAFPFANANATVALEFQAGKQYRLTAQKEGGAFDLMFWDEADGGAKRNLLTTSRMGSYGNVATTDSALLRGSQTNALGYGPWGEPFVRITAVDSQTIHAGLGRTPDIHVAAGRRLVTVELSTRSGWHATGTVELEFQAGRTYGLTACEVHHDFDVMFWIESPATETHALLATTRLRGRYDIIVDPLLIFLLRK